MLPSDLADESGTALLALFASKEITPTDVLNAVEKRIEDTEPKINAFHTLMLHEARQAAKEAGERWRIGEPRGILDGIPITIKDTYLIKGHRTTFGSAAFAMINPAVEDSPAVARLRDSGAVILGTTRTPELGWKAVTDSPSGGVTRNPWNVTKTPGGSSGGAAAAAAAGMGIAHLSGDGGGSIRIPSSFTSTFGFKPSFGRIPQFPVSSFGTLVHTGPIARHVSDAISMLKIISNYDARDGNVKPTAQINEITAQIGGLRIALCTKLKGGNTHPEIIERIRFAGRILEGLGAHVEEIDFPIPDCRWVFEAFWYAGLRRRCFGLPDKENQKDIDPQLLDVLEAAQSLDLEQYLKAEAFRAAILSEISIFHQKYDLLLTPVAQVLPFGVGLEVPEASDLSRWWEWAGFCYPFNLTGQPACSIPCGFSSSGLPIGIQIVGSFHADERVLGVALLAEPHLFAEQFWPKCPVPAFGGLDLG